MESACRSSINVAISHGFRKRSQLWIGAIALASAASLLDFVSLSIYAQPAAGEVATNTDLPPEVRAELEKQTAAMKAIYFNFDEKRLETDAEHPPGTATYSAYFEGKLFYYHRHAVSFQNEKQTVQDSDWAFNGTVLSVGEPKQSMGSSHAYFVKYLVADTTEPLRASPAPLARFPPLKATGFYAPEHLSEIERFSGVQPLVLHYFEQSDSTKVEKEGENLRVTAVIKDLFFTPQKNRRTLATTPERSISFLLDSKRGYGVVEREERLAAGQLIVRIQSEDWKYYDSVGIWLPKRCVSSYYTDPYNLDEFFNSPIFTITEQLNRVEFGHQDVLFDLDSYSDYRLAGTFVDERTTVEARKARNHVVTYVIAANGKLLRQSAESIMSRRRLFRYFLVFVILALPPIILFFQHRRKRTKI